MHCVLSDFQAFRRRRPRSRGTAVRGSIRPAPTPAPGRSRTSPRRQSSLCYRVRAQRAPRDGAVAALRDRHCAPARCRHPAGQGRSDASAARAQKAPKPRHRAAITDEKCPAALPAAIGAWDGWPTLRCALQFAALTFARPGEVRGATWPETDVARASGASPAGASCEAASWAGSRIRCNAPPAPQLDRERMPGVTRSARRYRRRWNRISLHPVPPPLRSPSAEISYLVDFNRDGIARLNNGLERERTAHPIERGPIALWTGARSDRRSATALTLCFSEQLHPIRLIHLIGCCSGPVPDLIDDRSPLLLSVLVSNFI